MSEFLSVPLPQVFDGVGVAGFCIYVLNYTMLTLNKLRADQIAYFAINGVAAGMVLIGLSSSFNLASALIQVFWIAISALAICIRLRRPARADASNTAKFRVVRPPAAPSASGPR